MTARTKGIGGHQSHASRTVEWLTPPETIRDLGGPDSVDLDPCAPIEQPYRTARRVYTILDDGLALPWEGRVFLNPPYGTGDIEPWLDKLVRHGRGTLLTFARTETDAFFRFIWEQAHAALFMRGRIHFHIGEGYSELKGHKTFNAGDRAPGNAGGPTLLAAYGEADMEILRECGIDGQFVPLIWTRVVQATMVEDPTWRELVAGILAEHDGPVAVADIVAAAAMHPKAKDKPHYREKVRQTLLRGAGRRVARGMWEARLI